VRGYGGSYKFSSTLAGACALPARARGWPVERDIGVPLRSLAWWPAAIMHSSCTANRYNFLRDVRLLPVAVNYFSPAAEIRDRRAADSKGPVAGGSAGSRAFFLFF